MTNPDTRERLTRINAHVSRSFKVFDAVATIHTDEKSVATLEADLIALLRPKYNVSGMPLED